MLIELLKWAAVVFTSICFGWFLCNVVGSLKIADLTGIIKKLQIENQELKKELDFYHKMNQR